MGMDFSMLQAYLDRQKKQKDTEALPEVDPNALRAFQQGSGFMPEETEIIELKKRKKQS